ncbi:MAG: PKD domain-containing protein [Calditrichaeota bacterium]|nr:MAG: PKD domain-containing protein [Calditrichota bacterium]
MLAKTVKFVLFIISVLHTPISAQNFTKITTGDIVSDGTGSRSVNFVDINNDSYPDIFITNGKSGGDNNMLFLNNADGTFTRQLTGDIVEDGTPSDGASFADFDNNGFLDCAVGNWWNEINLLYKNSDSGSFDFLSQAKPANENSFSESCSWADFDLDGDVDLFIANSSGDLRNFLYINQGNLQFTKDTLTAVTTDTDISRCGTWADYDNDGDPDLFVANETGYPNRLYQNNGDGTFTKIITGAIVTDMGNSWTASWGDYDNDSDFDLFVGNNTNELNFFYINNGDGTFTKDPLSALAFDFTNTASSTWIDFDNDGDLDLFIANGFGTAFQSNILYENDGAGAFTKVTGEDVVTDQGWSYGCAFGDYDKDGDNDLMVAKWLSETENNALYRNDVGSANNWIHILPVGTISNSSAIGTKIKVKAIINGSPVWQITEVSSQHGYCVQNSNDMIIGLGDAAIIDSIIVEWPNSPVEYLTSVSVNQFLTIIEKGVRLKSDIQIGEAPLDVQFSQISSLSVTSQSWDFGDSDSSVESTPLHTYTDPGVYSVQLDVTATEGNFNATRDAYIAVHKDSVIFQDQIVTPGSTLRIPVYLSNYLPLQEIQIPVQWTSDYALTFSDVTNDTLRSSFMNLVITHFDLFNKRMYISLTVPDGQYLSPGNSPVIEIVLTTTASASGVAQFSADNYDDKILSAVSPYGLYNPTQISGAYIASCCIGIRGNVDNDPSDQINIADLVYFVDYSFGSPSGPVPACFEEADVDSSTTLDIGDIVYLVNYSFGSPSGPAPLSCI